MAENKNTQGNTPENQGNTPENQGNTPENQGNTSETQGTKSGKSKKTKEEKLVPVFIPKQSRGDTERFIAVNGERILVQTGKTVEIPERFAEVLKNSEKMAVTAEEYINDNVQS